MSDTSSRKPRERERGRHSLGERWQFVINTKEKMDESDILSYINVADMLSQASRRYAVTGSAATNTAADSGALTQALLMPYMDLGSVIHTRTRQGKGTKQTV